MPPGLNGGLLLITKFSKLKVPWLDLRASESLLTHDFSIGDGELVNPEIALDVKFQPVDHNPKLTDKLLDRLV